MPWQRYRYYDFFPRSTPKKAKGRIKGQSKRGAFGQSLWAKRWIEEQIATHEGVWPCGAPSFRPLCRACTTGVRCAGFGGTRRIVRWSP